MKNNEIVVILDTSFFRSIFEVNEQNSLELIKSLSQKAGYELAVLSTVLVEFKRWRVSIQKLFTRIPDSKLEIAELKKINDHLSSQILPFERKEIGDYKFIAYALEQKKKGKNPIIVTNDEGIRNFVYKILRKGDEIAISFVADFIRSLVNYSITKEDKELLLRASEKIEKEYNFYRKRQGRNFAQKNALEELISSISYKTANKEVLQLNKALTKYFETQELDEKEFPDEFKIFYEALRDISDAIETGRLKEAFNIANSLFSKSKDKYEERIFAEMTPAIYSILVDTYYKLALELDQREFWWEAIGLMHSIKTLYQLNWKVNIPKRHIVLLETITYLLTGASGLEEKRIGYETFLKTLETFDLEFLFEVYAISRVLGNETLLNDLEKIILTNSGLKITNKIVKDLIGKSIDTTTKLSVKTLFEEPMVIDETYPKEKDLDVFLMSASGKICLRIKNALENKDVLKLSPGKIIIINQIRIENIKNPPPGKKWEKTFITPSKKLVLEINTPRGVLNLATQITDKISF